MKKKTKKRIELLELAIKAAEGRCEELVLVLDASSCPLCMNMSMFNGCDNCPAYKATFSCDHYGYAIQTIRWKLIVQAEEWKKEIERLKKI